MPILAQEVDVFPEDLLTCDDGRGDGEIRWWAVYTRRFAAVYFLQQRASVKLKDYIIIL